MTITRQECPACGGDCKLVVDFGRADYAWLDDRLLGLSDIACLVVCGRCGHSRSGRIRDLDYSWSSQLIEFGTIIYD